MAKTVAITGATGTLGRATTILFDLLGWRVRGTSLHGCPLLAQPAAGLSVRKLDIVDEPEIARWFDGLQLDALVTCAGVSLVKPSLEMTAEEWRRVIDVNLTGTFLSVREAVKRGATRRAEPHRVMRRL